MRRFRRLLTCAFALLLVGAGASSPADATRREPSDRVTGSFIVTLRDGISTKAAADIAGDHGGRVEHLYGRLRAFAFSGSDAAWGRLAADPRVRAVEPDRLVRATSEPRPDLKHLNRTDAYEAYDAGYTGLDVSIAIIDTGVQKRHPVFHAGQVVPGKSCVKGGTGDKEGHGTASASNAAGRYGVAHDATIVPVRVFPGSSLTTPVSKVICGLDWVDEQNDPGAGGAPGTIDVVNMSLAYPSGSDAFRNAVERVRDSGAVVVAAAGNNGGATQAPANFNGVIAVSGLAGGTKMASFSASGGDMTAPAVNVRGAENGGRYSSRTGTSRASPQVAGVAAIILALDPLADVQDVLRTSGQCPDGEINGSTGFCDGRWKGDDPNAEPLVNAYCAGILADPVGSDVPTCGF